MALWQRGQRLPEHPTAPEEDTDDFRAEVENAVHVMVTHRLKEAIEHVNEAMAEVRASKLSAVDRYSVTNHLLDAKNKLAGLTGGQG